MKQVKFKGNNVILIGNDIEVGKIAKDFILTSKDMEEVKLSDFDGKIKVITTFPSLDTAVCDRQLKKFNEFLVGLSDDIVVLAVSRDLPFAQNRFCEVNGIKNVIVASDYRQGEFSKAYGLYIKELDLTARSVLILNKNNEIKYFQLVGEIAEEPNYDDVIENVKKMIN